MLTLRQLEIFRAVMRCGTISGAARQLKLSQPTVTKTLARMEHVLKVDLFQRTAGRIVPTVEAHRLVAETETSYGELQLAIGRAVRDVHADEGHLRVGSQPSLMRSLAAPSLAALVNALPRVSVHLDVLAVAEAMGYLRGGPGECALTVVPIVSADVASAELGRLRVVALVPVSSALARSRAPLPAKAMVREAVISFEPHAVHGRVVHEFFAQAGVAPARTHMVRFADSAVAMAEAGLGVAIVDEMTAHGADRQRVHVRPLAFNGGLKAYFHRPLGRTQSRICKEFEALVRERFAALTGRP